MIDHCLFYSHLDLEIRLIDINYLRRHANQTELSCLIISSIVNIVIDCSKVTDKNNLALALVCSIVFYCHKLVLSDIDCNSEKITDAEFIGCLFNFLHICYFVLLLNSGTLIYNWLYCNSCVVNYLLYSLLFLEYIGRTLCYL